MARSTFGGTAADFVVQVGASRVLRAFPATLTLWTARTGGTRVTDLLLDGVAVDSIPTDASGGVPPFQGPDNTVQLWADAGGGARVRLLGDSGPKGDTGDPGINAEVSVVATETLSPGTPAEVVDESTSPNVAALRIRIPQGQQGIQGIQGPAGSISNLGTELDTRGVTFRRAGRQIGSTILGGIRDTAGRAALLIYTSGLFWFDRISIATTALTPGGTALNKRAINLAGDPLAIGTSDGRAALVVRKSGEVTARLASDSVIPAAIVPSDPRLGRTLTTYGTSRDFGAWLHRLRWTRMQLMRLLAGDTTQLDIVLIGDSYTQNPIRWSRVFADALRTQFGDAGIGYVGFAYPTGNTSLRQGSVRSDTTVAETGTWTTSYNNVASGPDLSQLTSSTPGSTLVVTFPAGQSSAKLFYEVTAGASITAQFNGGGGSQTVDLSTGGTTGSAGVATLTAPPAGATTLTLTVVGGTVKLSGVDIRSTARGVRVHKIATSGSQAAQWATFSANAGWRTAMAALTPQLVIVMHGPNDQTAARTASQFAADMTTILTSLNAALGATAYDRFLVAPPENQRGLPTLISDYRAALEPAADLNDAAFIDTQPFFGVNPADYAFGSARPWFSSDQIHPDGPTGGRVLADAILRAVRDH